MDHFPKDPRNEICKRAKFTRAPYRRKPESREVRISQTTTFRIQLQRITKLSMKRTNRDCIIEKRNRYRIWPLNGYTVIRAEPRLHKIR